MGTHTTLWSLSEFLICWAETQSATPLRHPSALQLGVCGLGFFASFGHYDPVQESIKRVPAQYLSRSRLLTCYLTSLDISFHL